MALSLILAIIFCLQITTIKASAVRVSETPSTVFRISFVESETMLSSSSDIVNITTEEQLVGSGVQLTFFVSDLFEHVYQL